MSDTHAPRGLLRSAVAVVVTVGSYVTAIATSPPADAALLPPVMARQVAEINQLGDSNPAPFVTIGATTYFNATDAAAGSELWRTDGTTAGTTLVKDIDPGPSPNGEHATELAAIGNTVFYSGYDKPTSRISGRATARPAGPWRSQWARHRWRARSPS
jgi:ELWxxDGT repeat protein